MLELPHTLIGAAIGAKINSPFLALPLALASHFLIDLIPHWNPSLYTETKKYGHPLKSSVLLIIVDTIVSLVVGMYIALSFLPDINKVMVVLAACLLAVLPDLIEAPYFFLGLKSKLLQKIIYFQHNHQGRAKLVIGTFTQVVAVVICLMFLY